MSLWSLIVKIGGDNSEFKSRVNECGVSADGLARRLTASFGRVLTAVSLTSAAKDAVAYADRLQDVKERLDVGARSAQQFFRAAEMGGTDIDQVASSMEKLRNATADALGGGTGADAMVEKFNRLGVTMEDLRTTSTEDIFRGLLDQLAEGSMTATDFAAAYDLVGKSVGKLIPMAKAMEDAKKGILFSDAEQESLAGFADKVTSLWTSTKALVGKGLIQLTERIPDLIAANVYGTSLPDYDGDASRAEEAAQRRRKALLEALKLQEAEAEADRNRLSAAERWQQMMDDALKAEREAAEVNERTRLKTLTAEERRAELLERRARIEAHLEHVADANRAERESDAHAAKVDAEARKELAEINAALFDMEQRKGGSKQGLPQTDALAQQGIFLGDNRRDPLVDIAREQLKELRAARSAIQRLGTGSGGFNQKEFF